MRGALPLLASACLIALLTACCAGTPTPYVPVREAVYRLETDLPLTTESRTSLVAFLKAGGDKDNLGDDGAVENLVDPGAADRYRDLLDFLAGAEPLGKAELEAGGVVRTWFKTEAVHQVVDARSEYPPKPTRRPFAFTDGRHWFVFGTRGSKVNRLLVMRSLEHRPEE